jgi:hypothetical protein
VRQQEEELAVARGGAQITHHLINSATFCSSDRSQHRRGEAFQQGDDGVHCTLDSPIDIRGRRESVDERS